MRNDGAAQDQGRAEVALEQHRGARRPTTTGPSGSSRCSGVVEQLPLLVRTVAANATRPSFVNSEGCRVIGPRSIHRDAPYSEVPDDGPRRDHHRRIAAPAAPRGFHTAYGTATTTRSAMPARERVDHLPLEVPEGVAAVTLRRGHRAGGQDHHEAEHREEPGGDQQQADRLRRARRPPSFVEDRRVDRHERTRPTRAVASRPVPWRTWPPWRLGGRCGLRSDPRPLLRAGFGDRRLGGRPRHASIARLACRSALSHGRPPPPARGPPRRSGRRVRA